MEFPGVNRKRCGISRDDKKNRGISMGSWTFIGVFGLGNSKPMGVTQFSGISRGETVSGLSKG